MSTLLPKTGGTNTPGSDVLELIDPSSKGHFDFIKRAHRRSEKAGLSEQSAVQFEPASRSIIKELVEKNNRLRHSALPFMETLREQIISTHSMVILTDATGTIIEALGDDEFLRKAEKVALQPGVQWSEDAKGTNAIGTALIEELPTVVHAQDHFLQANHFLTCSAAPIFDPEGMPLGVLDVTGDYRSYHRHTMGLVRMSAQMIENHLFNCSFQDAIIVQFHPRGEFLGSAVEGAAAFSPAGKFLAANRVAMIQFGMSQNALKMHTFSSLFGMPLSGLIDHYRASNPAPLTLCLHNGNQVIARATLGSVGRSNLFTAASLVKQNSNADHAHANHVALSQNQQMANAMQKHRNLSSLKYLNTGDAAIAKVIEKVGKVIDKDIPILILGETGTGKEILAQAIHNDSPRHNKPFVAVNCASIPETLIESELFGYEDGAFTGARKKGAQGKILQANGGTLFLDEIGDMPISLQARLLRVLQERVVTPLGSQKSYPVNLMVICATHRNLRDLITSGHFREDLYYRLHGLVVKLPALRERSDLGKIVQRVLENESDNPDIQLDPQVLSSFENYCWPGNIRQLTNILRTASVMAADRNSIGWDDLPDDFLDEIHAVRAEMVCENVANKSVHQSTAEAPPQREPILQSEAKRAVDPTTGAPPETGRPRFSIRANVQGRTNVTNTATNPANSIRTQLGGRPAFSVTRHGRTQSTQDSTLPIQGAESGAMGTGNTLSKFREERFQNRFNVREETSDYSHPAREPRTSNMTQMPGGMASYGNPPRHHYSSNSLGAVSDLKQQGFLSGVKQATAKPSTMNLDDLESQAIQEALEACRGNVSAAARMLGISRNTIYRRLNGKT